MLCRTSKLDYFSLRTTRRHKLIMQTTSYTSCKCSKFTPKPLPPSTTVTTNVHKNHLTTTLNTVAATLVLHDHYNPPNHNLTTICTLLTCRLLPPAVHSPHIVQYSGIAALLHAHDAQLFKSTQIIPFIEQN